MKKVIVSQVDDDAFRDAFISDFPTGISIRRVYKMITKRYRNLLTTTAYFSGTPDNLFRH